MADPGRGFDTIVAGEYERAFCGGQYSLMASLLGHYGVQLWAPDAAGGPAIAAAWQPGRPRLHSC